MSEEKVVVEGSAITSAVGSVTVQADANVAASGSAITSAVGSVTVTVHQQVPQKVLPLAPLKTPQKLKAL
jgi:hypothetical protein